MGEIITPSDGAAREPGGCARSALVRADIDPCPYCGATTGVRPMVGTPGGRASRLLEGETR